MPETKEARRDARRSPRFPSSKFSAPKPAPHLVRRARLAELLDQGEGRRLTLVVASPGAGKTALLTDWLAGRPQRLAAWLSCDPADTDPARFLAAIIEALRRSSGQAELGEDARQLLSLDGEVSADAVAALADDLEQLDARLVLVIDDFHITGRAGADVLGLLLEHQAPVLQIVLATRVDPPLRLNRMRATQELVELRERDLSFSSEETRQFLAGFGVHLSEHSLGLLQRRSEGWVAGLQMAALSIQHRSDSGRAAAGLELQRHTVTGYFLDEVFYRQPPDVVEFMLATSVLDELSVPAAAALCGAGSAALLERLYRDHLFVTLVDEQAGTFRYHQLIKEVLAAELRSRDPAAKRRLHEQAAGYLATVGRVGPAARQLMAAGDTEGAFRLLSERVVLDFANNPTLGSVLDVDDIRPDDFAGVPEILVPLATELLFRGAFERGSRALALAGDTDIQSRQDPELALRFAVVSAVHRHMIGEPALALKHADLGRQLVVDPSRSQDLLRGLETTAMYSHAYLGNSAEARELAKSVAAAGITPPSVREVLCPGVISQVALADGDLAEAESLATGALDSAHQLGFDRHYFAFTAWRTTALLALERRDLAIAAERVEHLLAALVAGRPLFEFLTQLDRARIWAARGNFEEALVSLPAARAALRSDTSVLLAQADELEARLRLALGDSEGAIASAQRLAGYRGIIVSTMIGLGLQNPSGAEEALRSLPAGPPPTIRADLELRLLRADLAIKQNGQHAAALVRDALAIAGRHGFVQTVLDTAPHVVPHLMSELDHYPRTDHLALLLKAGVETRRSPGGTPDRLADPLTDSEIRVLERLPQRLTYADIAAELHLSLNTVKTHLRHTYMKLGVASRSAAVKRAAALGFL